MDDVEFLDQIEKQKSHKSEIHSQDESIKQQEFDKIDKNHSVTIHTSKGLF